MPQDKKAGAEEALLQAAEHCNELDTLLQADLLRRQSELAEALATADVAGDRCRPLSGACFGTCLPDPWPVIPPCKPAGCIWL